MKKILLIVGLLLNVILFAGNNALEFGENTYTGTFTPYDSFWIGRAFDDSDRYFDRNIDEFRIWNDARTETEIRQTTLLLNVILIFVYNC